MENIIVYEQKTRIIDRKGLESTLNSMQEEGYYLKMTVPYFSPNLDDGTITAVFERPLVIRYNDSTNEFQRKYPDYKRLFKEIK